MPKRLPGQPPLPIRESDGQQHAKCSRQSTQPSAISARPSQHSGSCTSVGYDAAAHVNHNASYMMRSEPSVKVETAAISPVHRPIPHHLQPPIGMSDNKEILQLSFPTSDLAAVFRPLLEPQASTSASSVTFPSAIPPTNTHTTPASAVSQLRQPRMTIGRPNNVTDTGRSHNPIALQSQLQAFRSYATQHTVQSFNPYPPQNSAQSYDPRLSRSTVQRPNPLSFQNPAWPPNTLQNSGQISNTSFAQRPSRPPLNYSYPILRPAPNAQTPASRSAYNSNDPWCLFNHIFQPNVPPR